MGTATKKDQEARISIPKQQIDCLLLTLEGTTPLIVHRFAEKARKQIREKHAKKATKTDKGVRGPAEIAEEIAACHYPVQGNEGKDATDGRYGFPSVGFKAAAVRAATLGTDLKMARVKTMFFVPGEIIPVTCEEIEVREDVVRLSGPGAVPQLRYRPYYHNWAAVIGIEYVAGQLPMEQIVNLFDLAGQQVGLGENRPGRTGGTYGRFKIAGVTGAKPDDLPRFSMAPESNDILAQAIEIARKMGAA